MARFKIGSTYTLGYGIGRVKIEKPTAKGKTFKAVRLSDGKSIHFGDASMPTREDNPEAKKNYCSRAAGLAEKGFNPNTFSLLEWGCIPSNKANNMQINQIMINSTVRKSQIVDNGNHWLIKGIPVTVDNAKMNGIIYSAEENAKGMPSIVKKPITGGHPVRDGYPISVNEEMSDWYLGGNIVKHYNSDGVNYVDVKASKKMMRNSENPLGEYFANKLDKKESFGVSTGLNLIPVTNASGEVVATNQDYDHLGFLHDNEAPAGGNNTMVKFNSDSGVMVINLDDELKSKREREIEREEDKLDAEEDKLEDEREAKAFKKLVKSLKGNAVFKALFGDSEKTGYNVNETTLNNSGEDEMSKHLIAALASMGVTVNADMSEEQVKAELLKVNKGEKEAVTLESLSGQLAAMNAEMQELKTKQKIEDDKAEKDRLAGKKESAAKEDEDADITKLKEEKMRKREKAANSLGFSVAVVNAMTDAELDRALGMQAGIHANASGGFNGDKKSESVFGANYEWGA